MKVIEQGNAIKITGGNFAFLLSLMVQLVLIVPVTIFLSLMVFMSDEGIFVKVVICAVLVALLIVLVAIGSETLKSRTAYTLIDKSEQLVVFEDRERKDVYSVGVFKKLIVQLVSIPRGSHYQAYLVGEKGMCPLGMQSILRNRLTRIFKPISEKLGIPLEYPEQTIGISEALAIKESKVKS